MAWSKNMLTNLMDITNLNRLENIPVYLTAAKV